MFFGFLFEWRRINLNQYHWFSSLNQLGHISNIWSDKHLTPVNWFEVKSVCVWACWQKDFSKTDFGIWPKHKYQHMTAVIHVRNRLFRRHLWAFITGLGDNIPSKQYPNKYNTITPHPVVVYSVSLMAGLRSHTGSPQWQLTIWGRAHVL